ncbi:MAG: N-acetylmuramoyl-L-alanine amidase [Opitutaceae bacterium]|nr:N-acetylmuramoyl-L-alanine amidase [Opitutaceae bacterium]
MIRSSPVGLALAATPPPPAFRPARCVTSAQRGAPARGGPTSGFCILLLLFLAPLLLGGCHLARPRTFVPRKGDEIIVAGRMFHTGTRVVTWMDPGGYDAYRVERRFAPIAESGWESTAAAVKALRTPNRYGLRKNGLSDAEIERVRGGGWDLPTLQRVVDQFVLHYDVCGISKSCFNVLHDHRGLSIHFMLDIDGTIYQTLDLKERAWHATTSNDRSVGIEIANMGAYPPADTKPLQDWYRPGPDGQPVITVPERLGDPMLHTPDFVGRPARPAPVTGDIQNTTLVQYDLTPQQYAALIKLTAALCKVFPQISCDYPRDATGELIPRKLPDEDLARFKGVLGHYHIQTNKTDPGPALQWPKVINSARRLLGLPALHRDAVKSEGRGVKGESSENPKT